MPHGTAADSAATASLSEALAEFFRATRRARGRAASQTPADGISLAQFHLLEPLAEGPCTNRQLAEAAGITSPTATRMIDGLVGRGVVTRVEDPADRRAVLISLTDAGADALAAKVEEYSRVRVQLARTLEPEERLVAADLLNRLAVVIEEL